MTPWRELHIDYVAGGQAASAYVTSDSTFLPTLSQKPWHILILNALRKSEKIEMIM
jgi:hypothetical protein